MDDETIITAVNRFEGIIYRILIVLFFVVIIFAVIELGWLIVVSLTTPPVIAGSFLENREILNIFGFFLLVLIGIELLGTLKAYLRENVIHVEIVVILAIIAVARKVIILDPLTTTEFTLMGDGVLILGLCVGYYLIRKAGGSDQKDKSSEDCLANHPK
ncbi:MAG: phosphate-starvation-inducible PsiE family protein [Methanoregulaceae archaeon]|nr:phosphate-starvation-inducible PsiE family protein [Methanoregulaceae archaeon]